MKVDFYYSSKVTPGSQFSCDNGKAIELCEKLKAKGVNASAIDVEVSPPGFMKYNAAVTGPSASKRAVFGAKGALEEEFGIEVPDEQAEKLTTVGDVIKYIEEHQQK